MSKGNRPQDSFGDKAKKEGFAARSIYKLEEIDRRAQLLKRGMRVLDLGADVSLVSVADENISSIFDYLAKN